MVKAIVGDMHAFCGFAVVLWPKRLRFWRTKAQAIQPGEAEEYLDVHYVAVKRFGG
jgi:hypothetical protein